MEIADYTQQEARISLHALQGDAYPETFPLNGTIKNNPIPRLLDYGSNTS